MLGLRLTPIAALVALSLGLTACGGGGSSSTNASNTTVSGSVVDAPIPGATVQLMDGTTIIATATSAANGSYTLTFDNSRVASGDLLRFVATKGNIVLVKALGKLTDTQQNTTNQDITQTTTAQYVIAKKSVGSDNVDLSQLPPPTSSAVQNLAAYIKAVVDPCLSTPNSCPTTNTLDQATSIANSGSTGAPTIDAITTAIGGETVSNFDSDGPTIIKFGTASAGSTYSLYQYNNDGSQTIQTGTWSVTPGSTVITLTPTTETGTKIGKTTLNVSLLNAGSNTQGPVFIATVNAKTTSMAFYTSIPFSVADIAGKTLSASGSGNVVFNSDGTGIDHDATCNGSNGVPFNWSVTTDGALVVDESSQCTGEINTVNLLNKSGQSSYVTSSYTTKNGILTAENAIFPFAVSP